MAVPNQMPYDWRLGAQYVANKYIPGWWETNATNVGDEATLKASLQKQLYAALPTLPQNQYAGWLQDYTWLMANQGKMPTGFTQATVPAAPDTTIPPPAWGSTQGSIPGSTPTLPWDTGGQYAVPFPTQNSTPNIWSSLTDAQTQRALAYYSSALPYAELAESSRRFGQELDWKKVVDAYGTTGRAQLPGGSFVRRW